MIAQQSIFFKMRISAIILLAAGYGWAGGHFIPSDSPLVSYLFQILVLTILLVLGLNFFTNSYDKFYFSNNKTIIGLNIFTALSLLINIANILFGAISHNAHSFGSHNTLADLFPIGILITGNLLWLITIIFKNTLK